ncbi:MAG TPA: ABC transporter permease [Candidatus Polarisedimenticolaceae bacterium]|nr:ABC transporter permease [Candidatus Polarisedimenticolaceae bacterium]
MGILELLRFSANALRGHRLRTTLCLLGVAIGVAAVILLTSLGEGARLYVAGEFDRLGTNLLIITPGKTETSGTAPIFGGVPHPLTVADAVAVARHVPSIAGVAPLSLGQASARYRDRTREVNVAGSTADLRGVRRLEIRLGSYLPAGRAHHARRLCVIGAGVQRELFPGVNPLGEYLHIGEKRFQVIGVMAPRGTSLGLDLDEVVHVPVESGLRMFNQSSLFRIFAEVRSHQEIDSAKRQVIELLRERHGVEDVTVVTQDAVLETFGSIMRTLTAALAGIAAISLSVAGIGIMNVMLVSVTERTAEVGLLKALGASRRQIVGCFLVEATLISSAGGAVGLIVSLTINRLLTALYPLFPVGPPDWAAWGAVVVSVLVGVVFGALPARRAAALDPVAALARR